MRVLWRRLWPALPRPWSRAPAPTRRRAAVVGKAVGGSGLTTALFRLATPPTTRIVPQCAFREGWAAVRVGAPGGKRAGRPRAPLPHPSLFHQPPLSPKKTRSHPSSPTTTPHQPQGNASTLTRSEVQGGGKKPYAQKGTGNARQGSRRTPLKPGGGVVFGPKPVDWTIKMNKKERRLAMATALASAAASDVVAVDSVALPEPKTRTLVSRLAACGADTATQNVLLIADEVDANLALAARNVARLTVNRVTALNARDVLKADKIVVDAKALAYINDFYGPKKA